MPATAQVSLPPAPQDRRVCLHDIGEEDYEALLAIRGERAGLPEPGHGDNNFLGPRTQPPGDLWGDVVEMGRGFHRPMFDAACLLGAWVLGQPAPPFDRAFWADPSTG